MLLDRRGGLRKNLGHIPERAIRVLALATIVEFPEWSKPSRKH